MKLYVNLGRFFLIFSGLINSFGLSLFVASDMVSPDQGIPVGFPGKSICERLNCSKVFLHVVKMTEFWTRGLLRSPNDPSEAQERVLTHKVERSKWLEELAS